MTRNLIDIDKLKQGNEAAIDAFVNAYREAVFRLAYLILGDAHDAEDVTQEVFLRALRYIHRFDPNREIRPWLLSITTNLARNKQRSLSRYWNALNRFSQSHDVPDAGVEALSQRQQESVALWKAVRQLKASEQYVIYLRYFLELSVDETAEALDIAPGTVKSRLHRALKQLRLVVEMDFPLLKEGRSA